MKNFKYFSLVIILSFTSNLLFAQQNLAYIDFFNAEKKAVSAGNADNTNNDTDNPNAEESEKLKLEVNISATLISRFIWRGLELGDHPHIQPEVTFSYGNVFLGAWTSHGIAPVAFDQSIPGYKEVIPYVGVNLPISESFKITAMILDHYNPNFGKIGNWSNKGKGSNTLEARMIVKFWDFDLMGSVNFYNDEDHSNYVELGYTASLPNNYKVRPLVSFTPTKSLFNGTDDTAFTQVGIITSKDIRISDKLTIPIKVDFIVNPNLDKFFTAFGLGLKF